MKATAKDLIKETDLQERGDQKAFERAWESCEKSLSMASAFLSAMGRAAPNNTVYVKFKERLQALRDDIEAEADDELMGFDMEKEK